MKRLLAVLVGAGIAVGGGAAAWAGTTSGGGANREAAKACLSKAKAATPDADRATVREAVKSCLAAQGITPGSHHATTPEQQAKRDALKACLKSVKDAQPNADKATLRNAAKPCLEKAGITPGQVHHKLAAVKECRDTVKAAHSEADKATLRNLVKDCVKAK